MPEANLAAFNLEAATPSELEQRRRNIISTYSNSASVDDMSIEHLKELAAITSAMRRRTVTGPKSAKKASSAKRASKSPASVDDIFNAI